MTQQSVSSTLLMVAGVSGIAVGVYLPWVQTNQNLPQTAQVPTILLDGMIPGIDGIDFILLGAAGLVPVLYLANVGEKPRSALTLLSGVGTTLLCLYHLFTSSISGFDATIGFNATFVPAEGWYLTVLGGLLLTVAGVFQLSNGLGRQKLRSVLVS